MRRRRWEGGVSGLGEGLCLASASERRLTLLRQIGIEPTVQPVAADEVPRRGEPPRAFVLRMAMTKARLAAANDLTNPDGWFLGADTVVVVGKRILGKPSDATEALAMLGRLVGRRHRVMTGIAVCRAGGGKCRGRVVVSAVWFRSANRRELREYVATGESLDKAGAYGIQGVGGYLVKRLRGSYSGVVGLPLSQTVTLLGEMRGRKPVKLEPVAKPRPRA